MLDQHVRYYLRHHPLEAARHTVLRVDQGVYKIDDHEVDIEWQYAVIPGQPGHLVVVDGPMRQPFGDYLEMHDINAEYDTYTIEKTSALHHVPKEARMTFDDTHKKYTRLEAMKVAKEQASLREKAADYTRDGKNVPDELVRRYNKALRQKLRSGRARDDSPKIPRERSEPATSSVAKPEPPPAPQAPQEPVCQAPVVALMAHRGISLNGLPSYLPPQASASAFAGISRSWSGTNMPSNTMAATALGTAPSNYVAIPPGVAVPAPVGMAGIPHMANVCPTVIATAVPVGYYR